MIMPALLHHRRGISLLEVLISMGILTIGLVSVLSLIPAGRSQAMKAGALDRSVVLAQNAAADFITRGFARPAGWKQLPTGTFAIFDPLDASNFWGTLLSGTFAIQPKTDAATTASSTNSVVSAGTAVIDVMMRSEDDIRYSIDNVGADDPPVTLWSSGTTGRHVFDGNYSYLATLSGPDASWAPGVYKTLTIVTCNRRDASVEPVLLTSDTTNRLWAVNTSNVPSGMTLKELVRPGAMILYVPSGQTPTWLRVLLASDATDPTAAANWKLGLACEQTDPDASIPNNKVYLFPGANGSLQLPIRLEGTSPWND